MQFQAYMQLLEKEVKAWQDKNPDEAMIPAIRTITLCSIGKGEEEEVEDEEDPEC